MIFVKDIKSKKMELSVKLSWVPVKCETKQKRNETIPNETKRNQTKPIETKRNEIKRNETKRNEIFPKLNVAKKNEKFNMA